MDGINVDLTTTIQIFLQCTQLSFTDWFRSRTTLSVLNVFLVVSAIVVETFCGAKTIYTESNILSLSLSLSHLYSYACGYTSTAKLGCIKKWYFFHWSPIAHRRAAPSVGTLQAQQSPSNLCDSLPLSLLSRSYFAGRKGTADCPLRPIPASEEFSTFGDRRFCLR